MSVGWKESLEDATDVHEVLGIARDYLATWDRYEIAALPEHCRPGKMFDANDIQAYALLLVRDECAAAGDLKRLVDKMAGFFSLASVRCSQIMASLPLPKDETRQSV